MIADTMYAKYKKERDGDQLLETDWGFIFYGLNGKECYIAEMFVDESARSIGNGKQLVGMLGDIARAHGCEFLSGNIYVKKPGGSNAALAAQLAGFEILSAHNDVLTIIKKLEGA
jgi:GNAT superfamily N-acetyltransferase